MKKLFRFALTLTLASSSAVFAQEWKPTPVKDTSVLKPPPGSKVAIVEFMDLECPVCAQMDPIVQTAARDEHVAWVHHDFPLPYHNWSFAAAVNARYFDTKSPVLGNEYRAAVFSNQNSIDNVPGLTEFTQKFAKNHNIALPFLIDPGDKFADEVRADRDLARKMDLQRTPTIFVVADTSHGVVYKELLDRNNLDNLIEQEKAQAGTAKTQASVKHGE